MICGRGDSNERGDTNWSTTGNVHAAQLMRGCARSEADVFSLAVVPELSPMSIALATGSVTCCETHHSSKFWDVGKVMSTCAREHKAKGATDEITAVPASSLKEQSSTRTSPSGSVRSPIMLLSSCGRRSAESATS